MTGETTSSTRRTTSSARTTARLTALALATGTLVAATAGSASAAPADAQLLASGTGSALQLTLNLPAGVALPGLGTTITHTIALTDGTVSTTAAPLASTTALLGKGSAPVLSELLGASTAASLTGKAEDSRSAGPAVSQAGLELALLPLLSKVADPEKDGTLARSTSGVARLAVTGGLLPAELDAVTAPVRAVLEPALEQATGTASEATATVADTVTGAVDTLNGALAPTPAGAPTAPLAGAAKEAVTTAVAVLDETLAGLNETLAGLDETTSLVALDTVSSAQTITRTGSAVTSVVENGVQRLDVLGGLVSVGAITSKAVATAGGTKGSGSASFVAPVLDVKVADGALGFRIDEAGATLTGLATDALPADLKPVVDGALGSVSGLLTQVAGIDVSYGKGSTVVAPDGTSATSEVSATTLTVNPAGIAALLPAGTPFLTVALVPAKAVAASRLVAQQVSPPAAAAAPVAAPQALPRTGGLPLTGAAATALLGAALVVRRRRATRA